MAQSAAGTVGVSSRTVRLEATVAVLLAASAWLVWAGRAEMRREAVLSPVPLTLGQWTGKALEVTQRTIDILETRDVELKEYRQGGDHPPVWLARVAGFGTRAAFHPPELCYVGSHFEVLQRGGMVLMVNGKQRHVMRLVVTQDGAKFEAWYWFTANGRLTPSYYQQQAWLLVDIIRQKPIAGTLVRISTMLDDSEQARLRLRSFLEAFDAAGLNGAGVTSAGDAHVAT